MRVEKTYTTAADEQRWIVNLTNDEYEGLRRLLDAQVEYFADDDPAADDWSAGGV